MANWMDTYLKNSQESQAKKLKIEARNREIGHMLLIKASEGTYVSVSEAATARINAKSGALTQDDAAHYKAVDELMILFMKNSAPKA